MSGRPVLRFGAYLAWCLSVVVALAALGAGAFGWHTLSLDPWLLGFWIIVVASPWVVAIAAVSGWPAKFRYPQTEWLLAAPLAVQVSVLALDYSSRLI